MKFQSHLKWFFPLILVILISGPTTAQNPQDGILSKADARTVFAMSEQEWISNVKNALTQGVARATGSPKSGIGMATTTSEGYFLIVRPMYGKEKNRPKQFKYQLVIGLDMPN